MADDASAGETEMTQQAGTRDLETEVRKRVLAHDSRYQMNAYRFIYEALEYTQRLYGRDPSSDEPAKRHVTGQELLEGIRRLAIEQFGPLAPTVFRSWGVNKTSDFGEIVFNLVESKLMGKKDSDTRLDFAGGYDFDEAFGSPDGDNGSTGPK